MINVLVLIALLIPSVFAEEVKAIRITEDTSIEATIRSAVSHAKADLKGAGSFVTLSYSSQAATDVLILFTKLRGDFDPSDSLQVTLPAGIKKVATIDLRASPAWNPWKRDYRFHFLSPDVNGVKFHDVEFQKATITEIVGSILAQILRPESYTPASYHRLRGYTLLGFPLLPFIGITIVFVVALLLWKKRPELILPLLLMVTLLSHLRFSSDALAYSVKHLRDWNTNNTYETAGSLPAIAADIIDDGGKRVYLCNDGTSYAERMLSYYLAPITITSNKPTHVVQHRSLSASVSGNRFQCEADIFTVKEMQNYADGSVLFRVNPS